MAVRDKIRSVALGSAGVVQHPGSGANPGHTVRAAAGIGSGGFGSCVQPAGGSGFSVPAGAARRIAQTSVPFKQSQAGQAVPGAFWRGKVEWLVSLSPLDLPPLNGSQLIWFETLTFVDSNWKRDRARFFCSGCLQ